jgi:ATP-dependent Clp protease, protease subunit
MKTIDLFGVVGEAFDGFTDAQMAAELDGHSGPLTVRINSPGGYASDGIAIYAMLKPYKPRVEVLGLAASAASIIAMAGAEIHVSEAARIMIHNAWSIDAGNSEQKEKEAAKLRKLDAELVSLYARRSGQSEEQIAEWMRNDTYFTGKEAVAAGLATSYGGQTEEEPKETEAVFATLRAASEYATSLNEVRAEKNRQRVASCQQVARNVARLTRLKDRLGLTNARRQCSVLAVNNAGFGPL